MNSKNLTGILLLASTCLFFTLAALFGTIKGEQDRAFKAQCIKDFTLRQCQLLSEVR